MFDFVVSIIFIYLIVCISQGPVINIGIGVGWDQWVRNLQHCTFSCDRLQAQYIYFQDAPEFHIDYFRIPPPPAPLWFY
jgi:hypothetical protein